jgi:hypothetical protein
MLCQKLHASSWPAANIPKSKSYASLACWSDSGAPGRYARTKESFVKWRENLRHTDTSTGDWLKGVAPS